MKDAKLIDAKGESDRPQIARWLDDLLATTNKQVFSTIGVYISKERKYNGVARDDLKAHVQYNLDMRWGRALFVEGVCVNQGYLDNSNTSRLEKEFEEKPHVPERVTAPYH